MTRTSRPPAEDGQMIILALLVITVTFVVGAIVVDLSLWLSERRGSQTDADFASLAGAFQLLDPNADSADAVQAATDNLNSNDEQLNASLAEPVLVDDSCWNQGTDDAVTVNVRHDSRALFFEIFGMLNEPDVGAHAKACAGALHSPGDGDLVPFEINDNPGPCFDTNESPIFTSMCPIELGAQGANPDRGMLDLEASGDYCSEAGGSGDIEDMIEWGAPGTCLINTNPSAACGSGPWYDCVAVQNGNPQNVLDGVNARLARDGACDTDGDGVDEFSESVEMVFDTGDPFTSLYEARDCDAATPGAQISPRLVTIIILEDDPDGPSNTGYPIIAFAGFYLAGCAAEGVVVDDESDLDPDCDTPGNGSNFNGPQRFVGAPGAGAVPRPPACHQPNNPQPHGPGATPCPATPTPTPTPAPTPTPGGGTPTPSPGPGGSCGAPGHCVVYGRFVKLIVAGGEVGPPNDQSTLFGISLVE